MASYWTACGVLACCLISCWGFIMACQALWKTYFHAMKNQTGDTNKLLKLSCRWQPCTDFWQSIFITDWHPFLQHIHYRAWLAHFSVVSVARMKRWLWGRREVDGNHGSLPPFPYQLFFLINRCPPPVFLLYERRANTWLDLRAAELGRFNILILFYCPAAQSQTCWLYWHALLRWCCDEQAGT